MDGTIRTYLVGRQNKSVPCDIALPATETSVSRKHLELTVTGDGRYYIVHVHSRNTTKVWRDGAWIPVSQDFVDADTPLRLGRHETTVRHLLAMLGGGHAAPQAHGADPQSAAPGYQWDPEAGTIRRPRRS